MAFEEKLDLALVADPYRRTTNGRGYPIQEVVSAGEEGFVIAKVNEIFVCSCYAPPQWSLERFGVMMDRIVEGLTGRSPVVIGGDFNAPGKAERRPGECRRYKDLPQEWERVHHRRHLQQSGLDERLFTDSDHFAIRCRVGTSTRAGRRGTTTGARHWKTTQFDRDVFVEVLNWERTLENLSAENLARVLTRACDAAMTRRAKRKDTRQPVYWWTAEIADLRTSCLRARRRMQRARSLSARAELRVPYAIARSALCKAIKASKKARFRQLCEDTNDNPWGGAYRIVMAKTRSGARGGNIQLNKAPGPADIPYVAVKAALMEHPEMFRSSLQQYVDGRVFPDVWKRQRLVLLPKPDKPPGDPSPDMPLGY
ncbi:uncharacterized protein LOC129752015 [Uranotaenia lowii]|uniref:uncharacterized protein LOC129752015 n=1 Tax=Uranotaenia lowii TaxID=190385 RepID=UPI0024793A5D|nr:uncharacterized protein LOC129752015 [Uranotaenia lowii]